jgi:hypothetical protein
MSLLEHETDTTTNERSGAGRILLIILVLAGGAAAAYFALTGPGDDAPAPVTAAADPPTTRAPAPEPDVNPEPVEAPTVAEPEPEPVSEPEPEPALVSVEPSVPESRLEPLLRVSSDVPGASVFLDRRFLGTTPFETMDVPSGPHRLNVSSEGYDGFSQDIEIGDDLVTVDVRFLEVRLDASVDVLHKHRFGSCTGQLRADADGLHYETSDDDAFSIPFAELERHEVDYLEHTLTVEQRGGRTYNFTDEQETADALFSFHREVERARERLSQ